jgi:hypothetical protein
MSFFTLSSLLPILSLDVERTAPTQDFVSKKDLFRGTGKRGRKFDGREGFAFLPRAMYSI